MASDFGTVDASPTKELFIDMLTRDIKLIPAIVDLVDNCTDGARRSGEPFSNFDVKVELSPTSFVIYDNCGGIPLNEARNYAFRFGRPSEQVSFEGEVGRFGVGMKRALFKLGRHFEIWSRTDSEEFIIEVDVDQWAKESDWTFPFASAPVSNENFDDPGTEIEVTRLHRWVQERFRSEIFLTDLRRELSSRLRDPLANGFVVSVNGEPLDFTAMQLLSGTSLDPAKFATSFGSGRDRVQAVLYAGLGRPTSARDARREAGWYVFCNGRLLLEADKTTETVWGQSDDAGEGIPAFHPQFNQFRGFAYLTARESRRLPWNTTKTGLDTDSALYRSLRVDMIRLSRPVISFLNKLKNEKEEQEERGSDEMGPLEKLVASTSLKDVYRVKTRDTFRTPTAQRRPVRKSAATITYRRPVDEVEEVKKSLRAASYREVGEKTFDYYRSAECGDGES